MNRLAHKRLYPGYTLIELILSALIIATLVGISVPLFQRQFADLQLRNSSYNLARFISLAQQKAIGEGNFFKINFDFENGSYWLTSGEDLTEFKRLKEKYGRVYSLPAGVTLKAGQSSYIFFPNGTSEKIDILIAGRKSGFTLKSKGRLGNVEIKRVKDE